MNHLNIFNYYKSKDERHEDVLTRNFLVLVKNLPTVQTGFFEMIRSNMQEIGVNDIPSAALGELSGEKFFTQMSSGDKELNDLSEKNVLSIIISDEAAPVNTCVIGSDRRARYDGVIFCNPAWVFIIENKPSVYNVRHEQLNPNLKNIDGANLIDKPCCLSWREIITLLNNLMMNYSFAHIEKTILDDFLTYIDNYYSWLNPYDSFGICKDSEYLINKRCYAIMEKFGTVQHHKGWKDYFESNNRTIKQIAIDYQPSGGSWQIVLWLYAGNTMKSADDMYSKINIDKLKRLLESDKGFELEDNLHYAKASDGIFGMPVKMHIYEYIEYWKNFGSLKQLKRDEFKAHFDKLVNDGVIDQSNFADYSKAILEKGYSTLNLCPGFLIKYVWDKNKAVSLDDSDEFENSLKQVLAYVYDVFGITKKENYK